MTKKTNKFDALAYAVSTLGPPRKISKNRFAEAWHDVVSDAHRWFLPCGHWLTVDEWGDGDQSTAGGAGPARWADLAVVRSNDDGSLCPEYEEEARALIDSYAEAEKCRE